MSTTITVSTLDELYEALGSATGGETILLEGGDYGDLFLGPSSGFDIAFPENVTIASADPQNPAVFSSVDVRDASNLTFDGIMFDYTFEEGDELFYRPFSFSGCDNLTIKNSTFDGDVAEGVSEDADGYGYASGLSVRFSTGVVVEDNEVYGFYKGVIVTESDDVLVAGNDVHTIRMDGMNFAEVSNIVIENNYIHDFAGSPTSGDHCDMIQFFTSGTDVPSTNITISGNHLDIGEGTFTQSIFMRNEEVDNGRAGEEMFYQNVVIEDNVIVNGHRHGITVGETDGLTISNNSVLHDDGNAQDGLDGSVEIPRINLSESSKDVTVTDNIVSEIAGYDGQSGWTISGNAFVQDQDANEAGYYGDVFVTSTLQLVDGVHGFVALPGGAVDTMGAGASATLNPEPSGALAAHFQVDIVDSATRSFDASLTLTQSGDFPAGTTFLWDFGDGTTANGKEVSHTFPDGGAYNVELKVTLPDGKTDTQSIYVGIEGPTLVQQTETGEFFAYEYGREIDLNDEDQAGGAAAKQSGVQLGAEGIAISIDREHVTDVETAEQFAISMTLRSNSTFSAGEVLRLHSSFTVLVTDSGEIMVRAVSADGSLVYVETDGAHIDDLANHDIEITFAGEDVLISVDGEMLGTGHVDGGISFSGTHDLYIGNPWGDDNFSGVMNDFEITANADDFEAATPVDPPVEPPVVEPPVIEPPAVEAPTNSGGDDLVAEPPASEGIVVKFIWFLNTLFATNRPEPGTVTVSSNADYNDVAANDRMEQVEDQLPDPVTLSL
ncbi:MAG: right-handed parallel beta-helix repeat-containing protein [Rhodobacteraceae bacterium]|nr:right-handed parallel beta-helix repeat-containing protein [Paracoccaceae bacterium]